VDKEGIDLEEFQSFADSVTEARKGCNWHWTARYTHIAYTVPHVAHTLTQRWRHLGTQRHPMATSLLVQKGPGVYTPSHARTPDTMLVFVK
jgi:hypothetical protein